MGEPIEDAVLEQLVTDIDNQYSVTAASLQSMKTELTNLNSQISRLTTLVSTLGAGSNASKYVTQHLEKYPGEKGTFGLKRRMEELQKSYNAQQKNLTALSSLSQLYHSVLNGSDPLPTLPTVPDEDTDDPLAKPDFVYKEREEFPEEIDDKEWGIGSTLVVEGVMYIYVGSSETLNYHNNESGWEPVACQTRACQYDGDGDYPGTGGIGDTGGTGSTGGTGTPTPGDTTPDTGDPVSSATYALSLVKKFDDPYLWHMVNIGSDLYVGSYNASGSQTYYKLVSPYTSLTEYGISGSSGDESCRVYNLDGLFVTTEGGLIVTTGQAVDNHFLMCAAQFGGTKYVAWAKEAESSSGLTCEATYILNASTKAQFAKADQIFAFDMCEFNGSLFVVGCKTNPGDMRGSGIGYVAKISSSGAVSYPVTNTGGVITCCHVFNNNLFYGFGYDNAQVGVHNGSSYSIEKTFSGMGGFGDFCVYNNCLFASVFKQGGGMELWKRTDSGTWSLAVASSKFSALGTPGVNSGLKGWVGAMAVLNDTIYLLTNDNTSYREGPSYLFSVKQSTGASTTKFDLGSVHWLDTNVSGWSQTATLSSVTVSSTTISMPFNKTNTWATYTFSDNGENVTVNANPWIFISIDGTWYGATFEWFRPGQYSKEIGVVAGENIERDEVIPLTWKPTSGVTYGFMVSSVARNGTSSGVQERSNVVMVTWP